MADQRPTFLSAHDPKHWTTLKFHGGYSYGTKVDEASALRTKIGELENTIYELKKKLSKAQGPLVASPFQQALMKLETYGCKQVWNLVPSRTRADGSDRTDDEMQRDMTVNMTRALYDMVAYAIKSSDILLDLLHHIGPCPTQQQALPMLNAPVPSSDLGNNPEAESRDHTDSTMSLVVPIRSERDESLIADLAAVAARFVAFMLAGHHPHTTTQFHVEYNDTLTRSFRYYMWL